MDIISAKKAFDTELKAYNKNILEKEKIKMTKIYEQHAQAFSTVSAYLAINASGQELKISFKYPKDGAEIFIDDKTALSPVKFVKGNQTAILMPLRV